MTRLIWKWALVLVNIPAFGGSGTFTCRPSLDIPLAVSSIIVATGGQYAYHHMKPTDLSTLEEDDIAYYDRWAQGFYSTNADFYSDILTAGVVVPFITGISKLSRGQGGNVLLTDFIMYSEALAFSSGLNLFVRSQVYHPRPLVYNESVPVSERNKAEASGSFYSGHTSAAFLTAVFASYCYGVRNPHSPYRAAVWYTTLSGAALVGGLRVAAGKHYVSDVAAGAVAGSLFGFLIPRLHLYKGSDRLGFYTLGRGAGAYLTF